MFKFSLQSRLSTEGVVDKLQHTSLFYGEVIGSKFEIIRERSNDRFLVVIRGDITPYDNNNQSRIACRVRPNKNLILFGIIWIIGVLFMGISFSSTPSNIDLLSLMPFIGLVFFIILGLVLIKIEVSRIKADLIEILEAEPIS